MHSIDGSLTSSLEALAGHENEENTEAGVYEKSDG